MQVLRGKKKENSVMELQMKPKRFNLSVHDMTARREPQHSPLLIFIINWIYINTPSSYWPTRFIEYPFSTVQHSPDKGDVPVSYRPPPQRAARHQDFRCSSLLKWARETPAEQLQRVCAEMWGRRAGGGPRLWQSSHSRKNSVFRLVPRGRSNAAVPAAGRNG